jgi:thiamine-phosphate pyrophosphorylase
MPAKGGEERVAVRGRDSDGFGRLHLLTDPDGPRPVIEVVDLALSVGVPLVQVRVKAGGDRERLAMVTSVLERCRAAGATCIVNDRVDLALAAEADGVHLGSGDLPVAVARRLLGPGSMIGATVRDLDGARAAEQEGADYLGVGPAFATDTKRVGVAPLGVDGVVSIASSVTIPSVAIAGVTVDAARVLVSRGVTGVAVVGAVTRADDPRSACVSLLDAVEVGA